MSRATAALVAVAGTPLFLGGFTPFTWTAAGCAIATAAATLPRDAAAGWGRAQKRLLALALAAVGLGVLQLVPVSAAIAAVVAPGAAALDQALGGTSGPAPLSRDPGATREALLALVLGMLLVVVAVRAAARPEPRRALLAAVVAAAAVVALLGVAEAFLARPLLRTDLPPHARPFGPFANRNHAAALILLALPCAAGLARDLEHERRRRAAAALFLASGLLLLALVLNGSRGGLLAALLVVGTVALRARGRFGWKVAAAFVVAAAIAIPGSAWARRHELTTLEQRVTLASDALRMARDAPLSGIGLGAFGAAYPPYQTVPLDLRFRHAESEPLEVLVEGGIPLLLIGLAAALTIGAACARVLWRPRVPWADAGAALGVLGVLAHACCDFPLRIPGVTLPLLLVLGVVLALDASRPAARAEVRT